LLLQPVVVDPTPLVLGDREEDGDGIDGDLEDCRKLIKDWGVVGPMPSLDSESAPVLNRSGGDGNKGDGELRINKVQVGSSQERRREDHDRIAEGEVKEDEEKEDDDDEEDQDKEDDEDDEIASEEGGDAAEKDVVNKAEVDKDKAEVDAEVERLEKNSAAIKKNLDEDARKHTVKRISLSIPNVPSFPSAPSQGPLTDDRKSRRSVHAPPLSIPTEGNESDEDASTPDAAAGCLGRRPHSGGADGCRNCGHGCRCFKRRVSASNRGGSVERRSDEEHHTSAILVERRHDLHQRRTTGRDL